MTGLSEKNKLILQNKGLTILPKENRCLFVKQFDSEGNYIHNWKSVPICVESNDKGECTKELISNCPIMLLLIENNKYFLQVWNWVPGPGPGDFGKEFENEDAAMEFIISYYFGKNDYFEARKRYEEEYQRTKA